MMGPRVRVEYSGLLSLSMHGMVSHDKDGCSHEFSFLRLLGRKLLSRSNRHALDRQLTELSGISARRKSLWRPNAVINGRIFQQCVVGQLDGCNLLPTWPVIRLGWRFVPTSYEC